MNKTIYMTYKKEVPEIVFSRWRELNPEYKLELSLDDECIHFLETHFNKCVANLFRTIPAGMYKADLWRLCKLYIHGGVYADVDLVPHINMDMLDNDVTFYSCLSMLGNSIFQAFMMTSKPKSPLILQFILSFLLNKPYTYNLGPTYDMYSCIQYNLNLPDIIAEQKYEINEVKIRIDFGHSETNIKTVNLSYFPTDIDYEIRLASNPCNDKFKFDISDNSLTIVRLDKMDGWGYDHSCEICIKSNETIFLLPEKCPGDWRYSFITLNGNKILDSRDINYCNNGGW